MNVQYRVNKQTRLMHFYGNEKLKAFCESQRFINCKGATICINCTRVIFRYVIFIFAQQFWYCPKHNLQTILMLHGIPGHPKRLNTFQKSYLNNHYIRIQHLFSFKVKLRKFFCSLVCFNIIMSSKPDMYYSYTHQADSQLQPR